MKNNRVALPYYKDGKRIMFRGAENFGEGSYCKIHGKHMFNLAGDTIIPVKLTNTVKEPNRKEKVVSTVLFNAIVINLWEN